MSMLPTGSVWDMVRMFWRMSGSTARTVEYRRPMARSGRSRMTAATMSTIGATSGRSGESSAGRMPVRSFHAGVLMPSR